mgnify:CR=1 FL=1
MVDPRDIVTGLFAIIGTYFWYDKTKVESRLDNHQERLRDLEHKQGVLETKLDGIKEMLDVKFDMVMKELQRKKE